MPDPDDASTAAERSAYASPEGTPAGTAPHPDSPASPASPQPDEAAAAGSEGPSFLERMPWWAVPAILVGVPVLVALLVQVQPDLYDQFVWKYYWGPIKADAENVSTLVHGGVEAHSGYNVVNTLTWAGLLGLCIAGIAQMLVKFRAPMDDKMIVAATAWVVVGSAAHVLEDAGLFSGALQYLFITPPIYLLFGAFGIGSFLVGQWMKHVAKTRGVHGALRVLWLVHIVLVLVWLGLWLKDWPQIVVYVNPLWVTLFALANFFLARHFVLKSGEVDPGLLTLLLSLGTYLLVGAYIVTYITDPWTPAPGDGMPSSAVIAPALAAATAFLVYTIAKGDRRSLALTGGAILLSLMAWIVSNQFGLAALAFFIVQAAILVVLVVLLLRSRSGVPESAGAKSKAYLKPINLLLVFGQMVDAFATSIGIDLAGYQEKHVLSAKVIDWTREFGVNAGIDFVARYPTFLGFAPVKLLVSLAVIYAIDVQSKDDAQRHPTLIGLVKFAIIMVGIGPGVRDFTRLSLGV